MTKQWKKKRRKTEVTTGKVDKDIKNTNTKVNTGVTECDSTRTVGDDEVGNKDNDFILVEEEKEVEEGKNTVVADEEKKYNNLSDIGATGGTEEDSKNNNNNINEEDGTRNDEDSLSLEGRERMEEGGEEASAASDGCKKMRVMAEKDIKSGGAPRSIPQIRKMKMKRTASSATEYGTRKMIPV